MIIKKIIGVGNLMLVISTIVIIIMMMGLSRLYIHIEDFKVTRG